MISKTINKIKDWCIWNLPLYNWWKARKYFKKPQCHLYINKCENSLIGPVYIEYYNKFIDFRFSSVQWKWKYDEIRYERPPYISLTFFRKYQISLVWTILLYDEVGNNRDFDVNYWEFLLSYLYDDKCEKNLLKTLQRVGYWRYYSKVLKDEPIYILPQECSLNKNGYKELNRLVNDQNNKK